MGPRLTHQDTHGAFDDVKDVVLRVRVRARTLRMWLKPPFRDRVARFAFGFVGLEDRGDADYWIGTSLTGAENHSFASEGTRFIHASIRWTRALPRHLTTQTERPPRGKVKQELAHDLLRRVG